jgi:serine/threonine-protein kinase
MEVSSGPGKVPVPDVTGKDQTTATNILTQAGFRVRVGTQQYSATVPAGSVIQTNPTAGTTALQGSAVTLELSAGPAKVRVPYVLNYTEANARADIQARGLVVAESTQTVSDPSQDGVVLDQTPGAGVTVSQGSTVDLVIGQYQGTTTTTSSGVPLGL